MPRKSYLYWLWHVVADTTALVAGGLFMAQSPLAGWALLVCGGACLFLDGFRLGMEINS